jgi:hypothetical protein
MSGDGVIEPGEQTWRKPVGVVGRHGGSPCAEKRRMPGDYFPRFKQHVSENHEFHLQKNSLLKLLGHLLY